MVTYKELLVKALRNAGYAFYEFIDSLIMIPLHNVCNRIAWRNFWVRPRISKTAFAVRNKIGKHLDDIEEKANLMAEELDTDCYVLTGMRVKELNNYFWHNRS